MNLLRDPWICIRTRGGSLQRVAPFQITDKTMDAVDIFAPRPDFRGALYQLLIGLLQIAYAPRDAEQWAERFDAPPAPAELRERFAIWEQAFALDPASGPAFMQDLDLLISAEPAEIARLLIDNPGEKTTADSNDHFIHGGAVEAMCPACAATALFTLQINSPSGGKGNRVSLRGGGPLTTLRIPREMPDSQAILWRRLWSNVLPADSLAYRKPNRPDEILPWLAPTRTSDAKGAGDTTPEQVHPLQAYFSMPRRIRIDWADAAPATCDLCGEAADTAVRRYRTRPYGVNYAGAWVHPLTPYSFDPKQNDLPLSVKGQRGGLAYRHWAGLALGEASRNPAAARVVTHFNGQAGLPPEAREARLWCFGFDMDNMKSRCWYDATLPLPKVSPEYLPRLSDAVKRLLDAAGEMAFSVKRFVGAATHPAGTGDAVVSQDFWGQTEPAFYAFLNEAMRSGVEDEGQLAEQYSRWLRTAGRLAMELFDRWVLAVPVQDSHMQRTVEARSGLQRSLYAGKSKVLRAWIAAHETEAAA